MSDHKSFQCGKCGADMNVAEVEVHPVECMPTVTLKQDECNQAVTLEEAAEVAQREFAKGMHLIPKSLWYHNGFLAGCRHRDAEVAELNRKIEILEEYVNK